MKKQLLLCVLFISFTVYAQDENIKPIKTDSIEHIEKVPIYKGCNENLSNLELKVCMGEAMSKFVSKNFNVNIANTLNLPAGEVRILVQFKIDTIGNVIGIRAKAPHPKLEEETIRVLKLLPKLKPGMQDGKAVTVPYGFPIKFVIENKKSKMQVSNTIKIDKYPVYRGCNEELDFLGLKTCTTDKIKDFIKLSFDLELADRLFPLEKSTQFLVEFVIDKNGKVKDINAKAHKREIAAEAIKVVKRLPKFKKPGYSNGKPTDVPYSILMTIYF
ncbi:energy transducer TonB [Lacinutrix iliipiscaria]|uniref:Energy transducer TonB n=1 Tax=Lacinutrix iliipiscaria TaxID=1230532 RepID=A0ABW5WLX1_9FLAO